MRKNGVPSSSVSTQSPLKHLYGQFLRMWVRLPIYKYMGIVEGQKIWKGPYYLTEGWLRKQERFLAWCSGLELQPYRCFPSMVVGLSLAASYLSKMPCPFPKTWPLVNPKPIPSIRGLFSLHEVQVNELLTLLLLSYQKKKSTLIKYAYTTV